MVEKMIFLEKKGLSLDEMMHCLEKLDMDKAEIKKHKEAFWDKKNENKSSWKPIVMKVASVLGLGSMIYGFWHFSLTQKEKGWLQQKKDPALVMVEEQSIALKELSEKVYQQQEQHQKILSMCDDIKMLKSEWSKMSQVMEKGQQVKLQQAKESIREAVQYMEDEVFQLHVNIVLTCRTSTKYLMLPRLP